MSKLTLYHGSKSGLVGAIDPAYGNRFCDFGPGFYMGISPEQPRTLICGRENTKPILYKLELELDGLKVMNLEPGLDWLMFVAYSRGRLEQYRGTALYSKYSSLRSGYDIIAGKIANDRIYDSLTNFFDGNISLGCCLECLKSIKLGDQYVAVTSKACAAIAIVDERVITGAEYDRYHELAIDQRRVALSQTEKLRRAWRHREDRFFDEILEAELKAEGEA